MATGLPTLAASAAASIINQKPTAACAAITNDACTERFCCFMAGTLVWLAGRGIGEGPYSADTGGVGFGVWSRNDVVRRGLASFEPGLDVDLHTFGQVGGERIHANVEQYLNEGPLAEMGRSRRPCSIAHPHVGDGFPG